MILSKGYIDFFFPAIPNIADYGLHQSFHYWRMVQYNCSIFTNSSVFWLRIFAWDTFSVRMLLFGISQPINGLLADRLNRKSLMFWSNNIQIGLALSFI